MSNPDKIPLVLLPAFMSTRILWEHQIDGLVDIADITVVELTPYDSVAKMTDAVLDRAPERFALAGLSLGAFTAFEILRRAPERITRLALVSTSARADAPERLVARKSQIEAVQAGGFDEVVEGFLKVLQPSNKPWSHDVVESVRQMVHEAGHGCFFRQQDAMKNRVDSREILGSITCPTLVIHGRDDQSWPFENGEELARLIPGALLEVIEDAGHFPTLSQPKATTAALRAWLLEDR
jgi:pimeloyl-ACP methyl ester carboxylesterase